MTFSLAATALASALLAAVAILHVYWGFGGRWPGHDERSLVDTIVGVTPDGRMPSRASCLSITCLLFVAAFLPFAAHNLVPNPLPDVALTGSWVVTVVFAVRGIGGYLEHRIRPATVDLPYHRLNLRIYSPLCLLLALLLTISIGGAPPPPSQ